MTQEEKDSIECALIEYGGACVRQYLASKYKRPAGDDLQLKATQAVDAAKLEVFVAFSAILHVHEKAARCSDR